MSRPRGAIKRLGKGKGEWGDCGGEMQMQMQMRDATRCAVRQREDGGVIAASELIATSSRKFLVTLANIAEPKRRAKEGARAGGHLAHINICASRPPSQEGVLLGKGLQPCYISCTTGWNRHRHIPVTNVGLPHHPHRLALIMIRAGPVAATVAHLSRARCERVSSLLRYSGDMHTCCSLVVPLWLSLQKDQEALSAPTRRSDARGKSMRL